RRPRSSNSRIEPLHVEVEALQPFPLALAQQIDSKKRFAGTGKPGHQIDRFHPDHAQALRKNTRDARRADTALKMIVTATSTFPAARTATTLPGNPPIWL